MNDCIDALNDLRRTLPREENSRANTTADATIGDALNSGKELQRTLDELTLYGAVRPAVGEFLGLAQRSYPPKMRTFGRLVADALIIVLD